MGIFSAKCEICGSLEHSTSDCPHGMFSIKCAVCGSKEHATKDCPHGAFSTKCSVCGSENHATKDCPHGGFSIKCAVCGSKDHATKDCPHGAFSNKCSICGSKNHATRDCPHGALGGRTTSKHQTETNSSSDEGGLTGFVGKMLGYLIVGIIILAVVLWLLQNIVLPIILLNSALILTIIALSIKKQRTLFAVSALFGGGYMILDILNRWFSANFVENVVKNPEWISGIVYVNSAAIVLSAWFLVQPILSNAMFVRVTNKGRGFLLSFIAYFIVIASGIAIPLIYHTQPNSFVSNYFDLSLGDTQVAGSKEYKYIKGLRGKVKTINSMRFKALYNSGNIMKGDFIGESTEQYDIYGNKTTFGNSVYIYDEAGNLIEQNVLHSDGSSRYGSTYKYNRKGNKIKESFFQGGENIPYNERTFEYDKYGNNVECRDYFPGDDKWNNKITYAYDEKGNLIEERFYHPVSGFSSGSSYKYDEKGNRIERIRFDENGRKDAGSIYKYNDKGDLIEEKITDGNGNLSSKMNYSYEYDANGNWIKKLPSQSVFEEPIEERKIEYYQ